MGEFVDFLYSFIVFDHVFNSRQQCVNIDIPTGGLRGGPRGPASPFVREFFCFCKRVSNGVSSFATL